MNTNIEKVLTWVEAEELTGEYIVIPEGYTEIEDRAFEGREDIIRVTIPDSMTVIGARAFYMCTSLVGIIIPMGVKIIGDYAFSACRSLITINVDPDNPNYSSEDGVLFNKDKAYTKLVD